MKNFILIIYLFATSFSWGQDSWSFKADYARQKKSNGISLSYTSHSKKNSKSGVDFSIALMISNEVKYVQDEEELSEERLYYKGLKNIPIGIAYSYRLQVANKIEIIPRAGVFGEYITLDHQPHYYSLERRSIAVDFGILIGIAVRYEVSNKIGIALSYDFTNILASNRDYWYFGRSSPLKIGITF